MTPLLLVLKLILKKVKFMVTLSFTALCVFPDTNE